MLLNLRYRTWLVFYSRCLVPVLPVRYILFLHIFKFCNRIALARTVSSQIQYCSSKVVPYSTLKFVHQSAVKQPCCFFLNIGIMVRYQYDFTCGKYQIPVLIEILFVTIPFQEKPCPHGSVIVFIWSPHLFWVFINCETLNSIKIFIIIKKGLMLTYRIE
jgi:hypothetical protein